MYKVYIITNLINQKKYIGYTSKSLELRFEWHCTRRNCRKLRFAIDKYGRDNFTVMLLGEFYTQEEALKQEQCYITSYNTMVEGYNLTNGGVAPKMSEETKLKMSRSHTGKKRPHFSQEHKEKLSKTRIDRGIKLSKESILKALETKKRNAKPFPVDFGKRISERQRGKNNPSAKSVICITTGEKFDCIVDAAKKYNISSDGIVHVLKKRNHTVGKERYVFEYC